MVFKHSPEVVSRTGLIGSASGWGAQRCATEKGPTFMQNWGLTRALNKEHLPSYWARIITPSKTSSELTIPLGEERLPFILPTLEKLATSIQSLMNQNEFPCAIGGDHVMALGTFSGAIDFLQAKENFGLIWIDAHMDSHTPQTTPSYAYHGMPVAALLGYGDSLLTNFLFKGPKIRPEHLVLIGVRSFEPEEKTLLESLGVRIFYCEEVKKKGFSSILQESFSHVAASTKGFGVSIDLDAFDPKHAPGVGSPVEQGLLPAEVIPYLHFIRDHPKFKVLELTEFNPDLDSKDLTAHLIIALLKEILPKTL